MYLLNDKTEFILSSEIKRHNNYWMSDLVQREYPQNYRGIGWGQEHMKRAVAPKRCKIG